MKDFFYRPICCISDLLADSSLKADSSRLVVDLLPPRTAPWAGNDWNLTITWDQQDVFIFFEHISFFWGGEHTTRRFKIHRWKNYTSGAVLGVVLVGVGRCLVPRLNLFWFQSGTIDADVGKGGKCFGTKNTDNERDNEIAVKQHLSNMKHPTIQRGTKCLLLLCSIHDNTRNSILQYPKQGSKKAARLPPRSNCGTKDLPSEK